MSEQTSKGSPAVRGGHNSSFASPPVEPIVLADSLIGLGYNLFCGVPCSLISGLIAHLETSADVLYVAETREDAAIGLATGARLAGKQPVVLMQNSGLGVCINALTSLALMYKTPMLILVTWRGYQGNDAPEHIIMGDISPRLLETIGVPHREPSPETLLEDLEWATKTQAETSLPTALLLRPGVTR